MKTLIYSKNRPLGFSLVELLGIVAVVGILSAVGYGVFSNLNDSVKSNKLSSEVATLNSAASTYLGFGGNFDDVTSPEEALAKLRSVANSDVAERIPGLSSSMVDRRISAVVTSDENVNSGEVRVVWNASKKAFETATTGAGITSFYLNPDDAEVEASVDERDFAFLYAENDSWVWDFTDVAAVTTVPTKVTTYNPITITTNPTPPSPLNPTDPTGPETTPLAKPLFSTPGGEYTIRDYDLGITFENPNENGSSEVYYQIDHGNWEKYTPGTVIEVEPDAVIAAQAISIHEEFTDSSRDTATFSAIPVQLNPPTILPSSEQFGVLDERLIAVVLQNTNGDDPATVEYRIGNGPWTEYESFLLLDRVDFENGATISSRAVSEDPYYLDSQQEFNLISAEQVELASIAQGNFHNPNGGRNMVTNLPYSNSSSDYFEWGRITNNRGNPYRGLSKSSLEFEGSEVDDIALDNRFQIGELDYYNGAFLSGSGADSINLELDLAFNISGTTYNTAFDYEFELINTINDNNDTEGWASADFVRMDRSSSETMFEIDGLTFELVLEFGETSSDGFSNFDEFHVRENHGASSNVYATLRDRTVSQGNIDSDGTSNGNDIDDNEGGVWDGIRDFLNGLTGGNNGNGNGNGNGNNGNGNGNGGSNDDDDDDD